MSTTDAARESARRPDGQFGPQVRTELDPANAGLGEPEAPPLIGDLLEREIRLSDAFSREHPGFGLLLSQEGNIITVSVGDNDDMASIEVDVVVRPSDTEESLDRKVMDEAREALRRARVVFGGAQ